VVARPGGAGLDAAALSDLYLYRAWVVARADFNVEHAVSPTARAEAYGDLVRAQMATPGRQLNTQQFPPVVLEDWARAAADLRERPQVTLVVHAAPEAWVSCDGGNPIAGPATFTGLPEGEHLLRIDQPGWARWGGVVTVQGPTADVDVPERRSLSLDDAVAAEHARHMGARFALVAEPRAAQGTLDLDLRLVDASGARRNAAIASFAGDPGQLQAAVMRLDEQARTLERQGGAPVAATPAPPTPNLPIGFGEAPPPAPAALPPPTLSAPAPTRARFQDDPGAWARDHWPLLTAVGVMLGATLVLSVAVAAD
jgi:hypothetical protein